MPGSFFDSNVPLYLAAGTSPKADRAESLLSKGGVISVQVLNEIANVGLRKFGMSMAQLDLFLAGIRGAMRTIPVSIEIHELALEVRERHRFAFYDCAIVAAALLADCDTLWSEDMHDGLVIERRLTIRNPFAAA
ncbi:ribonuclease VapC [Sphingomonas glacialis]|uniref:Ribonuclease VapC n=1 Tax=Sphingomonas glacialis TaxID=658225 RepID=A0ABQ3LH80_9SPHN|nr:PIN domain-containing protein [Sphingomonas glacialis]GHH15405.1 ribonuclease VapC [Sphingomonas glacialis]